MAETDTEIGVKTSRRGWKRAGLIVVKVVVAPLRAPNKTGGTRIWACAHGLSRGVITELIKE